MQNIDELKTIIARGKTTTVQFKTRVDDAYKVGAKMVAFCNMRSGRLIIGVDDKTGKIYNLSFEEIRATNALLTNTASENVKPAIVINTETVKNKDNEGIKSDLNAAVERYLKILKDNNLVEYTGAKKTGGYKTNG
jgi:predicted HTH transcriptional regulator